MLPAKQQLAELKRGVVDFYVEEELVGKLERAVRTGKPLRVKCGFDPTAPDLHLGHTVVLNKMRQFQQFGHTVIFLIGDFTGMIGDPTGKTATRPILTREQIEANALTYKNQVFKILDPEKTEVRFNSEWFSVMPAARLIELASTYNVARMFEREDFRSRFREGRSIAIHEFLYPIVQAYDSVALEADVELGGHDQVFNLLVGRDVMRALDLEPQVVMTVPLLEGTDGVNKMSKSLGNYIGIDEAAEDIYGKTMSISDEMMWKYYELLSEKPSEEIRRLKDDVAGGRNPMEAKLLLAAEFVRRFKGETAVAEAEAAFRKPQVMAEERTIALAEDRVWLPKLLVELGFVSSNGEGRRMIQQGAVSIDEARIDRADLELTRGFSGLIRCGKRRFAQVRLT
ncbi:MAG: tyrosine--tRNA ligase [Myxococcales bacterium]|nr:MAG: tyrosine--tRNA ligase [Myxococcales bacterium]